MSTHRVLIIGCGGWGSTIARKLVARGDVSVHLLDDNANNAHKLGTELGVPYSSEIGGYLSLTGAMGRNVIVATPPDTRLALVRKLFGQYPAPPTRLRIEKPLALTAHEASEIVELCNDHGTELTVGYTLLHAPIYERAFGIVQKLGLRVVHVNGVRIGRPARHKVSPVADIGCHTASIAAYLNAPCNINASYNDTGQIRATTLLLSNGEAIHVNEHKQEIVFRGSRGAVHTKVDALEADLDAWLCGTHRATPDVAMRAQHYMEQEVAS